MATTPPESHDDRPDDTGSGDASFSRLLLRGTVGLLCALVVVGAIVIGIVALAR